MRRRARSDAQPAEPAVRCPIDARPRLHPLHVGLDRDAQGRDALPPERARVRRLGGRASSRSRPRTGCRATRRSTSTCRSSTCSPPRRRARRVVLVPPETSVFPVEVARVHRRAAGSPSGTRCPSILSMLVERGEPATGRPAALRAILFAGEVFPTKYLRRLMELLPHVALLQPLRARPRRTSAPTTRCRRCPTRTTAPIPIGQAIATSRCFAVDDDGPVATPGEVGELLRPGPTVMQGYWGDPERTARALVPDPLGTGAREPAYRTGDLVREERRRQLPASSAGATTRSRAAATGSSSANRGGAHAHPAVVECAVVAVPDELITNRIRAFVAVKVAIHRARDGGLLRRDSPSTWSPSSSSSARAPQDLYRQDRPPDAERRSGRRRLSGRPGRSTAGLPSRKPSRTRRPEATTYLAPSRHLLAARTLRRLR